MKKLNICFGCVNEDRENVDLLASDDFCINQSIDKECPASAVKVYFRQEDVSMKREVQEYDFKTDEVMEMEIQPDTWIRVILKGHGSTQYYFRSVDTPGVELEVSFSHIQEIRFRRMELGLMKKGQPLKSDNGLFIFTGWARPGCAISSQGVVYEKWELPTSADLEAINHCGLGWAVDD